MMNVIVGINCSDFKCVKKRLGTALQSIVAPVQIDVADGSFAPVKTWDNPEELKELLNKYPNMEMEIHLMVNEPEKVFEKWIAAGAKKLVVHIESVGDLISIRRKAEALGAKIIWGVETDTPIEALEKYLGSNSENSVQFLAVNPGFSGQAFDSKNIERIKKLRDRWPNIEIRVDGGINPETANLVRKAGADAIVSVSYISESENPALAYQELLKIQ